MNHKNRLQSLIIFSSIFSLFLFIIWINAISQRDHMLLFAWSKFVIYPFAVFSSVFSICLNILFTWKHKSFISHKIQISLFVICILLIIWYILFINYFIGPLHLPAIFASAYDFCSPFFLMLDRKIYSFQAAGIIGLSTVVFSFSIPLSHPQMDHSCQQQ